jgi:hypothetical protein
MHWPISQENQVTEVPQWIWNEIARNEQLATPWARKMFGATPDEVTKELDQQAAVLRAKGVPNKVIGAYQTVLPLWLERRAISEYVSHANDPQLRTVLPELTEVSEAVDLMTKQYGLTAQNAGTLYDLLEQQPVT